MKIDTITIRVSVPLAVAAGAGELHYGGMDVAPTAEQWAALGAPERALAIEYVDPTHRRLHLDAPASWEAVVAALGRELADLRAEADRRAADTEARIARALAEPHWLVSYYDDLRIYGPRKELSCDPRIAARLDLEHARLADWQSLRRLGTEVAAAAQAELDVYDAVGRGVRALGEAEETAVLSALWREYVLDYVEDYARAADDGCDVRYVGRRHAIESLETGLQALGLVRAANYGDDTQDCPHERAYQARDLAERYLADRLGPVLRMVRSNTVTIVRSDTCAAHGCKRGWRTCIEVRLDWLGQVTPTHLYYYADAAEPHEHEEDPD